MPLGRADSLVLFPFLQPPPQSFPNESSIQQKVLGLLVSSPLSHYPFRETQSWINVQHQSIVILFETFRRIEQHSRGRGAARWADGAGLLGPHQDSAAQPRGGGQLLRRGDPRTSDVTRRGSLDAQLWSSILVIGATGGQSAKTTCATTLHTIIFKSWSESFAFICLPSTLLLWSGLHPSVKWWPTGEIQHLYSHTKAIHSLFLYSV